MININNIRTFRTYRSGEDGEIKVYKRIYYFNGKYVFEDGSELEFSPRYNYWTASQLLRNKIGYELEDGRYIELKASKYVQPFKWYLENF